MSPRRPRERCGLPWRFAGQTQCAPSLEGARKGPGEGGPWPMALGEAGGRAERSRILCEGPLASPVVPAALLHQADRRNCAWVLAVGRTPPVGQAETLPLQRRGGDRRARTRNSFYRCNASLSGPWRLETPPVFVYW